MATALSEKTLPAVAELSAAKIKKLAGKLKSAKDDWQKSSAIDDLLPYGCGDLDRAYLLWHLTRTGAYDSAADLGVWELLATGAELASAEEILDVLAHITTTKPKKRDDRLPELFRGWPQPLDRLAMTAYLKDPAACEVRRAKLPKALQPGIACVRARCGLQAGAHADEILVALATRFVEGELVGLDVVAGKEIVGVPLTGPRDVPTPQLYRLVELFGTRERWNQVVLEKALAAAGLDQGALGDALRAAREPEQVATLIGAARHYSQVGELYETTRPQDSSQEVRQVLELVIAADLELSALEAITVVHVLRCQREGVPVDPALDEHLVLFSPSYESERNQYEGVSILCRALAALPAERALAIMRRALEPERLWPRAAAVVASGFADTPLLGEVMQLMHAADSYKRREGAAALAQLGVARLGWLAEEHRKAPVELKRFLHKAVLLVGFDGARDVPAGQSIELPEELDRFLTFGGWDDGETDEMFREVERYLLRILEVLPLPRYEAVMLREIEDAAATGLRVFGAIPARETPRLFEAACAHVARHRPAPPPEDGPWGPFQKLLQGHQDPDRFRRIGDEVKDVVRRTLAEVDHDPRVRQHFEPIFGRELYADLGLDPALRREDAAPAEPEAEPAEPILDRIRRLAAAAAAHFPCDTRIQILTRLTDEDDSPVEPGPADLNRVDGLPIGVDAASWPRAVTDDGDGERMDHLFTLDLRSVPQLAAHPDYQGVRALALFINGAGANSATEGNSDQTRLVKLTEADLTKGVPDLEHDLHADGGRFEVTEVAVPDALFSDTHEELKELRNAVYNAPGRVLGPPIWLQSDPDDDDFGDDEESGRGAGGGTPGGRFLLQFDERLCQVNLGDGGVMYVFEEGAFWQCH